MASSYAHQIIVDMLLADRTLTKRHVCIHKPPSQEHAVKQFSSLLGRSFAGLRLRSECTSRCKRISAHHHLVIEARRSRPDPIVAPYIVSDRGRGHEVSLEVRDALCYQLDDELSLEYILSGQKQFLACRNTQTCISISWRTGSFSLDLESLMM